MVFYLKKNTKNKKTQSPAAELKSSNTDHLGCVLEEEGGTTDVLNGAISLGRLSCVVGKNLCP